jgi:hypothetical protein
MVQMYNATRRSLQDFDNQHEFERLAADVLNALGFSDVKPIAPRGGGDGGKDITFLDGELSGVGFVTLDKKIKSKFALDLGKLQAGEGKIALFCNVDVTPKQRLLFAKDALAKGYVVDIYDLERLRSLFDSTLTEQRRRYLGIDDSAAAGLRLQITKLLKFSDAFPETAPPASILEGQFVDQLPRRLFDLLMTYDEKLVKEIPRIGAVLYSHMESYYALRQQLTRAEEDVITKAGTLSRARFRQAWVILYKYCIMRFGKISQDDIIRQGDFLNYSITWESAEQVFAALQKDGTFDVFSAVFEAQDKLTAGVQSLLKEL